MNTAINLTKYVLLLLLGCWPILLVAQKTPAASEEMRFRAQVQRDTAALKKLLADDLQYIHSNALIETKAAFLESIRSGGITYQNIVPQTERTIRTYGRTALVQGTVQVNGLLQGTPFAITLLYTSVYRRQAGRWQLVAWQSTRQS
jgi:hypothetical protein